jgi:hypothetical protein
LFDPSQIMSRTSYKREKGQLGADRFKLALGEYVLTDYMRPRPFWPLHSPRPTPIIPLNRLHGIVPLKPRARHSWLPSATTIQRAQSATL